MRRPIALAVVVPFLLLGEPADTAKSQVSGIDAAVATAAADEAKIEEAIRFLEAQQLVKAREALRDAKSLRADFACGLIYVFSSRDLRGAKNAFRRCGAHLPSLNNLALVETRLKQNNAAVDTWKTALSQLPQNGKWPKEISQNICRLVHLWQNGACPLSPGGQKKLLDLYGSLPVQARGAYDPHVGWLYMPFQSGGKTPWIIPEKYIGGGEGEYVRRVGEDRLCMYCDGRGTVKCPNKQCNRGRVPAGKAMSVAGTDLASGTSFGFVKPVFAACPVCGGAGKVPCPYCWNGIEKDLLTEKEAAALRSEQGTQPHQQGGQQQVRPGPVGVPAK